MRKLRSKLNYANVASSLALFLAISGGTAYAAAQIDTHDIKRHAVTFTRLAPRSVSQSRLRANSVVTNKIRDGAVTSAKVKNGSLQAEDFADGQLPQGPAGPQGPPGPAGGTAISGVVSTGGALVYGSGVQSVAVSGVGVYTVNFTANVSKCPAVATVGGYQIGGQTENGTNGGTVSLQPGGNDNATASHQITFVTRGLNGANTPLPFHFGVFC